MPTAQPASSASTLACRRSRCPIKRLLNGGNEIEFFRSLRVGERAVAQPKYADVTLKEGKSGRMLLVTIETRFTTESGEPLLVNRQTLIWR